MEALSFLYYTAIFKFHDLTPVVHDVQNLLTGWFSVLVAHATSIYLQMRLSATFLNMAVQEEGLCTLC